MLWLPNSLAPAARHAHIEAGYAIGRGGLTVAVLDYTQVGPAYMAPRAHSDWRRSFCHRRGDGQCAGDIGRYRAFHDGGVTVYCDFHADARRGRIRAGKLRKAKRLAAMKEPLTGRIRHGYYPDPDWVDDGLWSF